MKRSRSSKAEAEAAYRQALELAELGVPARRAAILLDLAAVVKDRGNALEAERLERLARWLREAPAEDGESGGGGGGASGSTPKAGAGGPPNVH